MDWLKTFSATFVGGMTALALVGLPTYVFLPREFDHLEQKIAGVEQKLDMIQSAIGSSGGSDVFSRLDTLVLAIARQSARPITASAEAMFAQFDPSVPDKFSSIVPADVMAAILAANGMGWSYAEFGDIKYVFVSDAAFNVLTTEMQTGLAQAFELQGVVLEVNSSQN